MNPGSSQFASQFPDAEETMTKMESKKLKTSLDPVGILVVEEGENYVGRLLDASINDARIAHEQREVIWKLVEAIHDECAEYGGYLLPTFKALDAAAPFLED